jgi:solute carrier family 25 (mitochondrial phosphate transporter), member 23/24/25/41
MAAAEVNVNKSGMPDYMSKFISHSECTMIAGGIAGCVGKTITAPLSRLTILLQVEPLSQSVVHNTMSKNASILKFTGSSFQAAKRVFIEEGLLSFWKGNLTSVFHRFPYSAINFTVYDELQMLTRQLNGAETPLTRFGCGSLAGGVACAICYPLDLVRTQLTVRKSPSAGASVYGSISSTVHSIVKQEGIWGLYRGLLISLAVTIPTFGISFCVYGTVKETILTDKGRTFNHLRDPVSGHLNAYGSMISGAMSGIVSSVLLFPADSIRRRMQVEKVLYEADHREVIVNNNVLTERRGAVAEMLRVLRGSGFRGLYRGLTPELLKVTPMVSITFCVYEFTYDLLNSTIGT